MPVRSPWTSLHARLHRILRQRQLLPKQQRILIAVSGGQDSLCLAKLLLDLQPKWSWDLAIAHCDHRWRSDSTANADHVQQWAESGGFPSYRITAPTPPASEAQARQWRYASLSDLAQTQGYVCLVTGHTASDRAETLLYNLMRGSGTNGLQALTWQRSLTPDVQLVRPLLEVTRAETAQFCQAHNLAVWEDSTNADWQYARNRIRQELFPYLAQHFNAQVERHLAQTAELLTAEVAYLEQQAESVLKQAIDPTHPYRLHRHTLQTAPIAIQRRVLRQWLHCTLILHPNFEQIEKLTRLIAAPNRTQTDPFPGGAIARVEAEWLALIPAQDAANSGEG